MLLYIYCKNSEREKCEVKPIYKNIDIRTDGKCIKTENVLDGASIYYDDDKIYIK
jgi:hypothetical protein